MRSGVFFSSDLGKSSVVLSNSFIDNVVRLKKPIQRKKYGLLSNYDDSVEMEAVESDEDDTLYEARSLRRSEVNTQQHHQLCVQKEWKQFPVTGTDGTQSESGTATWK